MTGYNGRVRRATAVGVGILCTVLCAGGAGHAQGLPESSGGAGAQLSLSGYLEAYWAWNFNRPANGVTNHRVHDNRHNAFVLGNAAIAADFGYKRMESRLVLQTGAVPANDRAEGATWDFRAANAAEGKPWRIVQHASVGYRVGVGDGLLIEMGLFASPMGPEQLAIHQQWNWSRSTLFSALPIVQAGARAAYPLTRGLQVRAGVLNGWSGMLDNNEDKTVVAEVLYDLPRRFKAGVRYVGGVERAKAAPEGRPWRSMVDGHLWGRPNRWLGLAVHGNGGTEQTKFGAATWGGLALYGRVQMGRMLGLSLRADGLRQIVPRNERGAADPILFAAQWVASGTATIDVRAQEHVALMLEFRHDHGGTPLYFRGEVLGSGSSASPWEANTLSQDTLLIGATAWF